MSSTTVQPFDIGQIHHSRLESILKEGASGTGDDETGRLIIEVLGLERVHDGVWWRVNLVSQFMRIKKWIEDAANRIKRRYCEQDFIWVGVTTRGVENTIAHMDILERELKISGLVQHTEQLGEGNWGFSIPDFTRQYIHQFGPNLRPIELERGFFQGELMLLLEEEQNRRHSKTPT